MKREIKELKRIARTNLQGNYMEIIRAFVICNIIVSLLELPFALMRDSVMFSTSNIIYYVAVGLIGIASAVLTAGQYRMHLRLARTGKTSGSELFIPAKIHSNRFIFTELLLFALSIVCLLPTFGAIALIIFYDGVNYYLIALGLSIISCILTLYISLTFDLVYFVMNDNENLSMIDALRYTKDMILTHRKRYFYMQLSFLGMMLLVLLSLGIGIFWVHPYMIQTTTLFYLDVKGELDAILEERKKNGVASEPTVINIYA